MRWIWIDKITEFESGRRAKAIKNVTMAEEHLHDHVPGFPIHPPTLMIEGMAQTAGILVGEARDYSENVILAKVSRAKFHDIVVPGDQIVFEAEVVGEVKPEGAATTGRITRGDDLIAEIDLMFVNLDKSRSAEAGLEDNFVFTEDFMQLLRMRHLKDLGGTEAQQRKSVKD
ncbi:MAG: 3-hydroxyacyl-ACP dehydratase FabZ family protein [Planctomycetia bacterium]|nr:3-hydroxyacyl-ACP dehydratase FabZ family protein [Planctomycetia bacterium]